MSRQPRATTVAVPSNENVIVLSALNSASWIAASSDPAWGLQIHQALTRISSLLGGASAVQRFVLGDHAMNATQLKPSPAQNIIIDTIPLGPRRDPFCAMSSLRSKSELATVTQEQKPGKTGVSE
jgi:hypothetical protein